MKNLILTALLLAGTTCMLFSQRIAQSGAPLLNKQAMGLPTASTFSHPQSVSPLMDSSIREPRLSLSDRRIRNSALWAFVSLNYLYADLVGLMDVNLLTQYQTGTVNGIEITPGFLTVAAAYMQLPLSNVFLPYVIRDERKLKWVQIVCGSIATVAQAATLFVGEPVPYYMLFSAVEIGTTAFITLDAIRWKPKPRKKH